MYYNNFKGENLSALGLGAMRLPCNEDSSINIEKTEQMVSYAIEHGINYFDTAYVYHGGKSELVMGEILSKFPRSSFKLATKIPAHGIYDSYDPSYFFEKQLKKCKVDYFDFYLLHNVCEFSMQVYEDPKWDIINYFIKQRELGRIKHLGFSSHARVETLEAFLDRHPGIFEFCQIQLNYLDWSLQEAQKKVKVLNDHNIPIWVMEPLRGGKLACVDGLNNAVEKGFRFLQGIDGVAMVLSGMSNMDQLKQNIDIFDQKKPLSENQKKALFEVAETLKSTVPCTKCRYCTAGCPQGLDIPLLISVYNELKYLPTFNSSIVIEAMPQDKKPSACKKCGACTKVCPQGIDIPSIMADLDCILKSNKSWIDVCKERAEIERKERALEQ